MTQEKKPLTNELLNWVDAITRHKHMYLEDAQQYLDSPEDTISTVRAGKQLSSKSNGTSKTNSSVSNTSIQRKKELGLAKMRREEVDRQCDAAQSKKSCTCDMR